MPCKGGRREPVLQSCLLTFTHTHHDICVYVCILQKGNGRREEKEVEREGEGDRGKETQGDRLPRLKTNGKKHLK